MKILAVYKFDHKDASVAIFQEGVDHLKKQGHNLKQDIDFRKNINPSKSDTLEKFQIKLEKATRDTDIVIVDISEPDAKIGYDIAKSIAEKKIVIALQKEGSNNNITNQIIATNARTLISRTYNKTNIHEVIDNAVEEAKGKLDTKFILIISPEIDRYLDWSAQTKRMHKAQIVRNSIEAAMKKDKEYKTYLQG